LPDAQGPFTALGAAQRFEFLRQLLISSIKGEVKKKHFSAGWRFSCFAAHLMEQDLF
jgi:hypothetical protein